jgi:hypothetical protein
VRAIPRRRDVRMKLESTRKLSASEWEAFKHRAIGEK